MFLKEPTVQEEIPNAKLNKVCTEMQSTWGLEDFGHGISHSGLGKNPQKKNLNLKPKFFGEKKFKLRIQILKKKAFESQI